MPPNSDIKNFILSSLLPCVLSPNAPVVVNVRNEFTRYLRAKQFGDLVATEFADSQFGSLVRELEAHMGEWDCQGVPRPLAATHQEAVFRTWAHDAFCDVAGAGKQLDRNYCEVLQYMRGLGEREFLVICALWLRCLGYTTIFVCDGPHDGGIDVLGQLQSGGLRSLVAAVQSKTSVHPIKRGVIEHEFGKFQILLGGGTQKYLQYRSALRLDASAEGTSWVYILLTNNAFDPGAQDAARRAGVLLRSVIQAALIISESYSKEEVETMVVRNAANLRADLTTNFFGRLSIAV